MKESIWISGPDFLRRDECEWPEDVSIVEKDELEAEFVSANANVAKESVIDFDRFSTFSKLARAVAWMKRFANNCRKLEVPAKGSLSVSELKQAELTIWRIA